MWRLQCSACWTRTADAVTGAVSGASPTCEPRMSPGLHMPRGGLRASLGPHQCASIGISWSQDRRGNMPAELESWLSKGRWGFPVNSQALGRAAAGRWGGNSVPWSSGKGQVFGRKESPAGSWPGQEEGPGGRTQGIQSKASPLSPPLLTFLHGHPGCILPESRPWDRLPTANPRGAPWAIHFLPRSRRSPQGRTGLTSGAQVRGRRGIKAALQPD